MQQQAPQLELEEENRQMASILSRLIFASWTVYLFVILIALYGQDWRLISVTLAGGGLLVVPFVLLKRRKLHASSLFVVLSALCTITFIASVGQGIRDLAIVAFPIVFIFAGLTLPRAYFRISVGLALLAVSFLVVGEAWHWFELVPFEGAMSGWFYLLGVILLLLVAALAVDLLAGNMRRNLERARLESAQRKQAEEALRESEHLFRSSIENAPVAVSLGRDGRLLYVNPTYARIYGFENVAELIGQPTLERVAPQSRELSLERSHSRSLGLPVEQQYELTGVRKDGTQFQLIAAVSKISLADGPANIGFFQDISERKKAELTLRAAYDELEQRVLERTAELQQANLALQQASRLKDEFLAAMSHELRTPLTGILGLSQVLQMSSYDALSAKQLSAVRNIEKSGQQLLGLITDILDFSQLQAGQLKLELAPCALADLCQAGLQAVQNRLDQKKQILNLCLPAGDLMLMADERRLGQALVLLLDNAIKFTPQGGLIELNAVCLPVTRQLRISVKDTGIGILQEDFPRLFQPFVQLDARLARMYNGAGLGLVMAKHLVELHGGALEVESIFGQGSCFSMLLPWEA